MASVITNPTKKNVLQAWVDASTSIKVMLLDSNHTNNIDTQEFIDDVSANEISGTGYTAGGAALDNVAVTQDDTDDEGVLDADDETWATATFTARYAVVYDDTGTPGTSQILCIIDFGENKSASGGNFTIAWNSEGIVNLT